VNPDHLLFTIQDDRALSVDLYVNKGRGYVEAEQHPADRSMPVDLVRIDALYSPVRRANFTVTETRVGQRTDFDRLTLAVETNGAIAPEDAVAYAAALAQHHFSYFVSFGVVPEMAAEPASSVSSEAEWLRALLGRSIDDCGLSVRSVNSLKNSGIRTVGDLVRCTQDQLLKVRNVGDKAVEEIADLLLRERLNFGMQWEDTDAGFRILDWGAAPVPPAVTSEAGKEE
jgi:DNA-directed RNA polymerase subunit alpha